MKKPIRSLLRVGLGVAMALFLAAGPAALAATKKEEKRRKELTEEATAAIELFKRTDEGLKKFFETSAGYVVFPSVTKGGIGLGGAGGKGLLYEKGKAVGQASLSQFTIGAQLGGQVYSEVIFFENADNVASFKEERTEFSAQVSAVAAAEGASKNAKYELGILVFTLAKKGLMFEASVGGQKFKFDPYEE